MNITGVLLLFLIAIFIQIFLKPKKNKNKYNNFNKYKKNNQEYYMNQKEQTITIKMIGEHFNKSSKEINKIFNELYWIEKKDRWWILTKNGEKKGGKELYNPQNKTKYTVWNNKILNDTELINKIYNSPKENLNSNQSKGYDSFYTKNKTTKIKKTKKTKGAEYETYIAKFFREQGYIVWEHGKEKGVKDSSIDLIIKKENYLYFIQCKNWENWKINHKEIKATRTDIREYLKKEKDFWNLIKNYKIKLLYVTPKKCLTRGAYKYIEENKEIVEYQVIPYQNQ